MRSALLLLLIAGAAYSLVVGYHVEPQTAAQSGWTRRGDTVAQVITVNGKKLEFRFTRGATVPGDSFQFYYDSVCGYNYGQMIAPYPPPTAGTGLTAGCDGHPMSSVV
jgi:hypothetical protein